MTTTVVLATRNEHKVVEFRRILAAASLDVELLGVDSFPNVPEVPETAATFAENASAKAREVAQHSGHISIADDSGLCVDALNGMPGVLSARWCGRHGDDAANTALVLAQMSNVPAERRGARFHCSAAVSLVDGTCQVVAAALEGTLATMPIGEHGFGYDPIFVPDGEVRTTAQMKPQEKDQISHRGRALRALVPVLESILQQK